MFVLFVISDFFMFIIYVELLNCLGSFYLFHYLPTLVLSLKVVSRF